MEEKASESPYIQCFLFFLITKVGKNSTRQFILHLHWREWIGWVSEIWQSYMVWIILGMNKNDFVEKAYEDRIKGGVEETTSEMNW